MITTAKTVHEIINEPTNYGAWQADACPNRLGVCMLVSGGNEVFACRTCGTRFDLIGRLRRGDWSGRWPWDR